MTKRLSLNPDESTAHGENVSASMYSGSFRNGVKVWFSAECTQKKSGFATVVSSQKPKIIYVLPGRICSVKIDSVNGETGKFIQIDAALTTTISKTEVTLEYPGKDAAKPNKDTFHFNTEQVANDFLQQIQQERTRNYMFSDNFTPKFQNDLNAVVRARINAGDEPLKELFLSTFNAASPTIVVEALFTNYRRLTDFEEASPAMFSKLLSAVAQDPVIYILFLCCNLQMTQATMDYFQAMSSRVIDGYLQLFEDLLRHIHTTVSKPEWKLKKDLLLAQFQYPDIDTTAGAELTHEAVLEWTRKFTNNYRKFDMDIGTLNRLLVDEKFLCFACLQHHADKGYVQIVQETFGTVPPDYFFSIFDLQQATPSGMAAADGGYDESEEDDGNNPWHRPGMQSTRNTTVRATMKPHFVEFLFHRNLSEKTVFMHLLQAFKSGKGYDDAFFTMFLNEAMQRDKPRVAVDLINTILFTEKGEPSVHALIFCPNIPVIIFEALLGAIVNISDGVLARVSDDMRVLLEIVLRFQYFALKMELGHIRSPARLFRDIPEKKAQFSALLEATSFLPHIIHVCNHNLAGRAEVIASAANMHHNDSFGSNATPTNVNMGMRMTSVSARSHEEDGGDIEPIDITLATVASTATGTAVAVKDVPQLDGGTDRAAASHVVHQNGAATTGAATGVGAGGSAAEHTQQQQSPGKDKYATWLDRNDGNLIALIYGFFTLVIRCGPIPALRDTTVVENETVVAFLQALDPAFYYVLLQPGTHLRARVTDFLREQFNIVSLYDKILDDPLMLCKPQHFSYSFLHALAYDAHHLSGNMVNLLAVAVILEQYEGLYQHLRDIDYELGPSEDKQHQLNAILFYTLQRDGEELVTAGLQLQDICSFANTATSALANARGNWEKERAVNDQLERLLAEAPVEAWAAGFQALAV